SFPPPGGFLNFRAWTVGIVTAQRRNDDNEGGHPPRLSLHHGHDDGRYDVPDPLDVPEGRRDPEPGHRPADPPGVDGRQPAADGPRRPRVALQQQVRRLHQEVRRARSGPGATPLRRCDHEGVGPRAGAFLFGRNVDRFPDVGFSGRGRGVRAAEDGRRASVMNRRQLGLGAATAALTSAVGLSARAQTRDPAAVAFYDSFNARLARLPASLQPDVRAFYEMNGWRPVWNEERRRALASAASKAERHGLSRADFFGELDRITGDPAALEMATTAAALAYARVLAEGRVRPETVEDLWEMQ